MDNCPSCTRTRGKHFYQIQNSPVQSTVLLRTNIAARSFTVGKIALKYCLNCGLVYNSEFNNDLVNYSLESECWQGCSEVFDSFNSELVRSLVSDFNIRNKTVVEIGCGSGAFLKQLCEAGNNKGIGFDPAFKVDDQAISADNVRFIKDYYSNKYCDIKADAYLCLMTLEHIYNPMELMTSIKSAMNNPDAQLIIQVPDMAQILEEGRFWDIYYEHCNYFTKESLTNILSINGFKVEKVWTEFGDQYLFALGKYSDESRAITNISNIDKIINSFNINSTMQINSWHEKLVKMQHNGSSIVLWGSVSKAAGFMQATKSGKYIDYIVDINPKKAGKYLPGFGHKIVSPNQLKSILPDLVIIMNPIYNDEITKVIQDLGIQCSITALSG